jgi:outer membrane lipase/esterase
MPSMNFCKSLRPWATVAALAAAGLLSACGGGNEQVDPFVPKRVLAFGDQVSLIEADGRKHSINGFKQTTNADGTVTESTTELDCSRFAVWTQAVAGGYALPFDRCLGTATIAGGQMLAQAGHKVADLGAQIAAVQGAALNDDDLALVLLGLNDLLELYVQYPNRSRAELVDLAKSRGTSLGQQVNALAQRGPAVVILTMYDLGLTPFALAQNTSTGDNTRAALLSELSAAFNDTLSVTLVNDGRLVGLAYMDTDSQTVAKFPSSFGFENVQAAACRSDVVAPACTTATLAEGANAATWLWADGVLPGPGFHNRMANAALTRSRSNPF